MNAANWIALAGVVLPLSVWIFYAGRMKGKMEAMQSEIDSNKRNTADMIKALQDHKESPTPHVMCSAHTGSIVNVEKSIEEMKQTLSRMDNRIYNIAVKNGIICKDEE